MTFNRAGRGIAICFAAAALASCSAGQPPVTQSPAASTELMRALPAGQQAGRAKRIYFPEWKNGARISYVPATANGKVTPTKWIGGDKTHFEGASIMYVPPSGALYSCNEVDGILGFAGHAKGNVQPFRRITGEREARLCYGLAVMQGLVGAVNYENYRNNSIATWLKDQNDIDKPSGVISGSSTELDGPSGLAYDVKGNLYVCNQRGSSITVYPAGIVSGNIAPTARIAGRLTTLVRPILIAIDAEHSTMIVVDQINKSIVEFGLSQDGDVKPIAEIRGKLTQIHDPQAVAVDGAGYIYLSEFDKILVFAPGSDGNVAPVQKIQPQGLTGAAIAVK
jgi:DNA-binding beta-propeller fold protein YncE